MTYGFLGQILQSCKLLNFLKLGYSCGFILRLSSDYIFALHKTDRSGKTNIQKGGMNRRSKEFGK